MKTIHSLYYHNPQPDGVERMIKYHQKLGYRFISLAELYEVLKRKSPVGEKLAFISLDDGWRGNLKLLPIFEKYKVPMCIFVAIEPIESGNYWWEYVQKEIGCKKLQEFKNLPYKEFYQKLAEFKKRIQLNRTAMTKEELLNISKNPLVTIQSHTVTHPLLTKLPTEALKEEFFGSKEWLEEVIGKDVYGFSYPNGWFSIREEEMCGKCYSIAFSTRQDNINVGKDNILSLPRYALTGRLYTDLLKIWGIWKYLKTIEMWLMKIQFKRI